MFHVKALVVDNLMVSVGSTNFDNRSFRLNDEANLNVLDPAFAKQQVAVFNEDWGRTKQITLAAWEARPWHTKMMGKLASLIGTQL
jgi:cardiolipin synthase